MKLVELFLKHFKDTTTVTTYERFIGWVNSHLQRIEFGYNGSTYDWIEIGSTIFFKTSGGIEEAKILDVIILVVSFDNYVGFVTTKGNIWYYEAKRTREEAENVILKPL